MRHFVSMTALLALVSGFMALQVRAEEEPLLQWRRWEQTLTSSLDYSQGGGNPYRDLRLRVRFTHQAGSSFVQDAFFDSSSATSTAFKVRSMFYPGSWQWEVVGCTGSTGGLNCAADGSWSPAEGEITVLPDTTSGQYLYRRGRLRQIPLVLVVHNPPNPPLITSGQGPLEYYNRENFFWAADTAWTAPPREIFGAANSGRWNDFIQDRRNRGFSVVLVAPAPAWEPGAGDPWPALPSPVGFSFLQSSGCSGQPIPNPCSAPRKEYWDAFDGLVQLANEQGLVVGVVGVIDPVEDPDVSGGPGGTLPDLEDAENFARYLAARLAGNHVVFSPGFDTQVQRRTYDNAFSAEDVMREVGALLKEAAPQHLVTNHLAGRSTCNDYQLFQDEPWMTFYLFQSGHAKNDFTPTADLCLPRKKPGESATRAAMRRAREMPLTLRSFTDPFMPAINGEAVYDNFPSAAEPDTRYRLRQAAHLSFLSGSQGFTYGARRLWGWYNVNSTALGLDSVRDTARLFARMRGLSGDPDRPIFLTPRHDWILNQVSEDERKMALATRYGDIVLAYLPRTAPSAVTISTSSIEDLECGSSEWSFQWLDPEEEETFPPAACSNGSGQITVSAPVATSCNQVGGACDWLLQVKRVGSGGGGQQQGPEVEARDDHWTAHPGLVLRQGESGLQLPPTILDNDQPPGAVWAIAVEATAETQGTVWSCGISPAGISLCYAPPSAAFSGEDSFLYTIAPDGESSPTSSAEVTVYVQPNRAPEAVGDVLGVPAGAVSFTIADAQLLANDSDPDGDGLDLCGYQDSTAFGALSRQSTSFVYTPGVLFSQAGSETFRYSVCDDPPAGGLSADAWVALTTPAPGPLVFEDNLDGGDLSAWTGTYIPGGGSVAARAKAAQSGPFGLEVAPEGGTSYAFAFTRNPQGESHLNLFFQLDAAALLLGEGDDLIIASGIGRGGNAFDLRIGWSAGSYRLRAFAYGASGAATPWVTMASPALPIRVEWWAAEKPGTGDGGLRLWLGEHLAAELGGVDNAEKAVDTLRAGIAGGFDPGITGSLDLDTFRLWRGSCTRGYVQLDDFETGDLRLWDATYIPSGGDLQVISSAALEGGSGLAVTAKPGSTYIFAVRESLQPKGRVHSYFRLDPATLTMDAGVSHGVYSALSDAGGSAFDLRLGRSATGFRLRALAWNDSGAAFPTPWVELGSGETEVWLEWWASSGGAPGGMRLWVDGVFAGDLSGLDNPGKVVEKVRFGVVSGLDAGTLGTFHLDDLRVWVPGC